MSKMKLIAIIVGVVLLAGGVGGGVFFFLQHSQQPKTEEPHEEEAPVRLYYEMTKPLTVNFPKDSTVQVAQISVAFLVADEETLEAVKKHEPMIRNNLLMLISGHKPETLITREQKEKLGVALLNEVNSVLKKMTEKNQIKELFFTSFVMQ